MNPFAGTLVREGGVGRLVVKPWMHARDCTCDVTQTFTCAHCGRRFGWCMGAADNMPEACDLCWRPRGAP
jgi:hypothetical protein